jgi:hypothetical protein
MTAVAALIIIPFSRRPGRMPGPSANTANFEPILGLAIHGTGFRHPCRNDGMGGVMIKADSGILPE